MASEKPLAAVTCTAPVNIAVIKYLEMGFHRVSQAGLKLLTS
uniref:Mevalonate diphosphate decarboxylase n=1 Tax=Homo sapiens TaxID=9606 RepID=H3BRZ1_HUMAN